MSYVLPKGETVPVLRPSKENYRFSGWYNGEAIWNVSSDIPTSNMTLTAAWTPIPTYRVSFDTKGGSLVAVQTAASIGMPVVGIFDRFNYGQDEIERLATEYVAEGEGLDKLIGKLL